MAIRHIKALAVAVGFLLLWGGPATVWSDQRGGVLAQQSPRDEYQRSLKIYEFRKAAPSGPARGEEIYYYRCWYCHNEYTTGAPRLDELRNRDRLLVTEKILQGGPAMPAYRAAMTDADVKDLVDYLLGGKCCFDSHNPPPNPEYRPVSGSTNDRR